MNPSVEDAFDSIESAHDFVSLLADTVREAKQSLDLDVQRESTSGVARRLDALRLAQYNLARLEIHASRSSRILNDLRTLRRLLFEERSTVDFASSDTMVTKSSELPVPSPSHAILGNVAA